MKEVFKPVNGYPGYYVSNLGRVMSKKRYNPIIITQNKTKLGFVTVQLYQEERLVSLYVARLVLEAFKGFPADPWLCVAHNIDGDLNNNNLDNLEWLVCETSEDYDPSKSHKKGVLKPAITKARMTAAKYNQKPETIEKAIVTRRKTVELRNMKKIQDKLNGK